MDNVMIVKLNKQNYIVPKMKMEYSVYCFYMAICALNFVYIIHISIVIICHV